jgi:hypothetical protein
VALDFTDFGRTGYAFRRRMANIQGWFARSRVLKELGITEKRLRLLVEDRVLRPERDFRHRQRFDPEVVAQVKAKLERGRVRDRQSTHYRSGEVAAAIFEAFRAKQPLREIVISTKQTPDYVLGLRRQYAEMGGDMLLAPRTVDQLRDLLDWQGQDETSLIRAVSERLRYQFQQGAASARDTATDNPPTNGVKPHGTNEPRGPEEDRRDARAGANGL